MSALSALKMIKYLYAKFLYLFGLASNNPQFAESVWRSANSPSSSSSSPLISESDLKPSARWPLLLYLGLVCSAPYIIWKLLSPLLSSHSEADWVSGEGDHYQAKVLHTFTQEREGELSVEAGTNIRLAPKHLQPRWSKITLGKELTGCFRVRGWLLAGSEGNTGLVPANYIQILGRSQGRSQASNVRQPDIVQGTVATRAGGGSNSLDSQWARQLS